VAGRKREDQVVVVGSDAVVPKGELASAWGWLSSFAFQNNEEGEFAVIFLKEKSSSKAVRLTGWVFEKDFAPETALAD
jgi:hypothetical protein